MHITRDEFQALARPLLERTVALTLDTIRAARIGPESIAGVFLVGGSSRIPFVSTLLHRRLGVAPTIIEQPELVVATGAAATELPTTDSEAAIGAAAELPSTGRPAPVTRQAAPTTEAGPTVRLEPTATTAPEPAGAASWTWESRIPTGLVVAVHALAVPLIARLVGHLFTDRPPTGLDLLLGMALLVPGIAILVSKRKATRGAVATVTIMFDAALLAGGVALSLARTVAPVQELWRNEIPPSNGWSTLVFVLSVALFLSGVLLMARGRRVRLAGPSKDVS